jgi:TetR/AcrR family transcriptional repressor for divergent bdcA
MNSTDISCKPRGRPRSFDLEQALARAEALFHEHGYDGVSVATIAARLGINPPSFYAAFGSKAGLFAQILQRYARASLPLDDVLRAGRPMPEALAEFLEAAARVYTADPAARGCLVVESMRDGDCEAGLAARGYRDNARARIRAFVAATVPAQADRIADFVVLTLSALSAGAREGWSAERLVDAARMAALAIPASLTARP